MSGEGRENDSVERMARAVRTEKRRRWWLRSLYFVLLVIPIAIGVSFALYGRTDRVLVKTIVQQEVTPIARDVASQEVDSRVENLVEQQISPISAQVGDQVESLVAPLVSAEIETFSSGIEQVREDIARQQRMLVEADENVRQARLESARVREWTQQAETTLARQSVTQERIIEDATIRFAAINQDLNKISMGNGATNSATLESILMRLDRLEMGLSELKRQVAETSTPPTEELRIRSIELDPPSVVGGEVVSVQVTLNRSIRAPRSLALSVRSHQREAYFQTNQRASPSRRVKIDANTIRVRVPMNTRPVNRRTTVRVSAQLGNQRKDAELYIKPR